MYKVPLKRTNLPLQQVVRAVVIKGRGALQRGACGVVESTIPLVPCGGFLLIQRPPRIMKGELNSEESRLIVSALHDKHRSQLQSGGGKGGVVE